MYSPRRYYRRYQKKKYYRNNLFAPSLKKAPNPNYYQMKGRILQQSPRLMVDLPTGVITRDILDDMYEKLKEYKYPIPTPIPPTPIDPSQFFFHFVTDFISLATFDAGAEINNANIYENFVEEKLQQLPPAPEDYHYIFNVTSIIFQNLVISQTDNSRFSFTLDTPILTSGHLTIISKTNDSILPISGNYPIIMLSGGVSNNVRIARVGIAVGSINYSLGSYNTTDVITSDDGFYPLITSDINSESYPNYISYSKELGTETQLANYLISFSIDIELVVD